LINVYPIPPEAYDFLEPTLFQCLSIISPSTWDFLEVPWLNLVMRYDTTLYNLGPYCASLYLFLEVRHALKPAQSEIMADGMEMEAIDFLIPLNTGKKAPSHEVVVIQDIISGFEGFFLKSGNPNIVPISVPMGWCTPKLSSLKDILLEFYTATFQAIIFVEQRQVAACLSKVLPAIAELKDKIRSAHLVGKGANVDGVSKTTDAYHGDAVEAFRKGKVNVREYLYIPILAWC
jgi:endoribonuclease Dicer